MLKSCLLGEAGDQTLQSGSDHTWEYLNFNQKKPLEEQQVEAMGSDQHVVLNAPLPDTGHLQGIKSYRNPSVEAKMSSECLKQGDWIDLGSAGWC